MLLMWSVKPESEDKRCWRLYNGVPYKIKEAAGLPNNWADLSYEQKDLVKALLDIDP
tara:strand:+ start:16638 stop:16808 length:171 start_codon:yes stop_codon:yes gene_type:complete